MYNSIWVILLITGTLLVLSLALHFASKKKSKSFGVFFLIPISIALMAMYGLYLGLGDELTYQNALKERRQVIANFADDYDYYLESYQKVLDDYNNLSSSVKDDIFKTDYNLEPTLNPTRLKYKCLTGDTFYTYFERYYSYYYYYSNGKYQIERDDIYYDDYRNVEQSLTLYVYSFSGSGSYSKPNFIEQTNYQFAVNKLQALNQSIEQGIELQFYQERIYNDSSFRFVEYVIMLAYVGVILVFTVVKMMIVFVKGGANIQTVVENSGAVASNANVNLVESVQQKTVVETPAPPKPTWEELSTDEQKPYLEQVIKVLYEKQLKDPTTYDLTREQIAMRTYTLQNKQFYLEDLTEVEAASVKTVAKENYENGKLLPKTPAQMVEIPQESNKSILKKGFKWFIYNSMITTRERQLNTKTTTFKSNGYGGIALEQRDNSNKASLIRPCGKCMSVSGEKPLDFVVGFNPFKKVFYCCGVFKGFSFVNEDILQYRMLSSNAKSEKYELVHKTGKKIIVSFNPVGSELLNAVLGVDKLVG